MSCVPPAEQLPAAVSRALLDSGLSGARAAVLRLNAETPRDGLDLGLGATPPYSPHLPGSSHAGGAGLVDGAVQLAALAAAVAPGVEVVVTVRHDAMPAGWWDTFERRTRAAELLLTPAAARLIYRVAPSAAGGPTRVELRADLRDCETLAETIGRLAPGLARDGDALVAVISPSPLERDLGPLPGALLDAALRVVRPHREVPPR